MSSLSPLDTPLDLRLAKHLLRRATFNYSKEQLEVFVGMSAIDAVNSIAINPSNILSEPYDPLPKTDPDGYWTSSLELPNSFSGQNRKRAIITAWWWYNAINRVSLKHKLSFFLHTSFTVGKNSGTGPATSFYDHINLLDYYALGNIKTFAKKITLDNSMLYYLNNTQNNKNNPNENYAREFLELFTILKGKQIGEGNYTNYTEADIQQAAKIFSGFKAKTNRTVIDPDTGIPSGYANFYQHDKNNKTFSNAFGKEVITAATSASDMTRELSDFVDMVFRQQETALAYCRKLYRFFVKSEWDEAVETDIITPLAQQLSANDFNILPVIKTLLSSKHFFDADDGDATDNTIGALIKSPLQLLTEVCSIFGVNYPNPQTDPLRYYTNFFLYFLHNTYFKASGMELFDPDSVAGYPAYYQEPGFDLNWFSSNTLIGRYKLIESLITGKNTITTGNHFSRLDTVLFTKNKITKPSDPIELITEIAILFYPEAIDSDRINYFKTFLVDEGFPDYYWTGTWNQYLNNNDDTAVRPRLNALITAMVNANEFQLM